VRETFTGIEEYDNGKKALQVPERQVSESKTEDTQKACRKQILFQKQQHAMSWSHRPGAYGFFGVAYGTSF
jgi:hypothetical protein